MKVSITTALPQEAPEIEKIHLKYYQEIGQDVGVIASYFNDKNRLILVAKTESQEIVGYLTATIDGTQSFAEWIGVKVEDQKIGSALAEKYIEECKKLNVKWLKVATRNRFQKALIIYIKYGFQIFGVYQGPDGDLMIQLRKKL
jgi:ribosomal protein S18 acetylase RimI-like enzyme